MSIEYKTADQLPLMEEVSENTYAVVEENGVLKRVPGSMLGGSGGIKTAIIKSSDYDNVLAGIQTTQSAEPDPVTYECLNMTFEEVYQTMANGEPLTAVGMVAFMGIPMNMPGTIAFLGTTAYMVPCIAISFGDVQGGDPVTVADLYWTENGLSTEAPRPGVPV